MALATLGIVVADETQYEYVVESTDDIQYIWTADEVEAVDGDMGDLVVQCYDDDSTMRFPFYTVKRWFLREVLP